jgi:hypothetical protein
MQASPPEPSTRSRGSETAQFWVTVKARCRRRLALSRDEFITLSGATNYLHFLLADKYMGAVGPPVRAGGSNPITYAHYGTSHNG